MNTAYIGIGGNLCNRLFSNNPTKLKELIVSPNGLFSYEDFESYTGGTTFNLSTGSLNSFLKQDFESFSLTESLSGIAKNYGATLYETFESYQSGNPVFSGGTYINSSGNSIASTKDYSILSYETFEPYPTGIYNTYNPLTYTIISNSGISKLYI